MSKKLLMGNEAIALAAIAAGVNLVAGYPGTPSTEVIETVAKNNPGDIHVEWSTNEKAALEVAAGASMSGARTMVTMKQVGLNVASDPLMTLAYLGVEGGMVVLVADDPGPISSQTEQDTRTFSMFAHLPLLDPTSPEEAYDMVADAFEISEKHHIPVLLRPTTRICHACAPIEVAPRKVHEPGGFTKDTMRWVIFPRTSYADHLKLNEELPRIADEFCGYHLNTLCDIEGLPEETPVVHRGIVTAGVSDAYALEALADFQTSYRYLHIATPHPFPDRLAAEFLEGLDEVLVIEELDPVVERQLLMCIGSHHLPVTVRGKLSGDAKAAGENTVESVHADLLRFFAGAAGIPQAAGSAYAGAAGATAATAGATTGNADAASSAAPEPPALPVRPPVLCPGCPHRGSFYAVKKALKGRKAVFSGDIGCYTLGNAAPLDMVDTCLCMGGGICQAQGIHAICPDTKNLAFVGDSTFFASGITGMVNAVYNDADITLVVLDNSTTAMTGNQPNPGSGRNAMGEIATKVSIDAVLKGIGLTCVKHADPFDLAGSIAAVSEAVDFPGPSAIIFESPCIQLFRPTRTFEVDTHRCSNCHTCINEIGCPALIAGDRGRDAQHKVHIDSNLCYGCDLCTQICPFDAIHVVEPATPATPAASDGHASSHEGGAR